MTGYRASGFLFLLINGFASHGSGLVGLGLRVAGLTWVSQNQGGGFSTQRLHSPLIQEYTLNCSRIPNMI